MDWMYFQRRVLVGEIEGGSGWMPGGEAAADQKSFSETIRLLLRPPALPAALHPPPRMNDIDCAGGLARCQHYNSRRHYIPCHSQRLILSH